MNVHQLRHIHYLDIMSSHQYLQFQSIPTWFFFPFPFHIYIPSSKVDPCLPTTLTYVFIHSFL